MKHTDEPHARTLRPSQAQRTSAAARPAGTIPLIQVYPLRNSRRDILLLAAYFIRQFAIAHGRDVPGLSEEAANFLAAQRWTLPDLASRLARAVKRNDGSLITADDLADF
jgi:DNA-binding NtrC family response regulator